MAHKLHAVMLSLGLRLCHHLGEFAIGCVFLADNLLLQAPTSKGSPRRRSYALAPYGTAQAAIPQLVARFRPRITSSTILSLPSIGSKAWSDLVSAASLKNERDTVQKEPFHHQHSVHCWLFATQSSTSSVAGLQGCLASGCRPRT